MSDKVCTNCKFLAKIDSGYSNYTVEETELVCLKGLNPDMPAYESYDWETKNSVVNKFGNVCSGFGKGESVEIDVDKDGGSPVNYSDDLTVKALLLKNYGTSWY